MAERMDRVTEILAEGALKAYENDCQKKAQNNDKPAITTS